MIAFAQLLALGYTRKAIRHRVATGKLFRLWPGVYAVGRPEPTQLGWWMAAVLVCGEGAALCGRSAGEHWGILRPRRGRHDITLLVPSHRHPKARRGIAIHRRTADTVRHRNIPTTTVVQTIVDLAAELEPPQVETLVNEADAQDLITPPQLRAALDERPGQPGNPLLRTLLDRDTFVLTDTVLERLFLPIARRAGLPTPRTQAQLGEHRVDFFWPDLGLVVEADSLRYHRTASKQRHDRVRDQENAAAGRLTLRFTHYQVAREADYVERILVQTALRRTGT